MIVLLHFLVAWSTFCILWISHTLTTYKRWCCCTSNCSNKRRMYKRKKDRIVFFSWNGSNKRFVL